MSLATKLVGRVTPDKSNLLLLMSYKFTKCALKSYNVFALKSLRVTSVFVECAVAVVGF